MKKCSCWILRTGSQLVHHFFCARHLFTCTSRRRLNSRSGCSLRFFFSGSPRSPLTHSLAKSHHLMCAVPWKNDPLRAAIDSEVNLHVGCASQLSLVLAPTFTSSSSFLLLQLLLHQHTAAVVASDTGQIGCQAKGIPVYVCVCVLLQELLL